LYSSFILVLLQLCGRLNSNVQVAHWHVVDKFSVCAIRGDRVDIAEYIMVIGQSSVEQ